MAPIRPTRRRRHANAQRVAIALAIAVLWHLGLVGLLILNSILSPATPLEPKQQVAMRTLSAEDWERNRGDRPETAEDRQRRAKDRQLRAEDRQLRAEDRQLSEEDRERREEQRQSSAESRKPAPAPEPEPEPEKDPEEGDQVTPPGKVVATPLGNDQVPDDKAFAAETDNKVDRQTLARDRTTKWKNAQRAQTAPEERQGRGTATDPGTPQVPGNGGDGDADAPKSAGASSPAEIEIPNAAPRQEIAVRTPEGPGAGPKVANQKASEAVEGNSERLRIRPGTSGGGAEESLQSEGRRGSPGMARLMPSTAVMDEIVGSAPSDLRDDDLEEGDATMLNTKQWRYASFFNRVKQGVSWAWDPGQKLRRRDPTGAVFGGKDRVTVLSVTLDAEGYLKDVDVTRSSGLDFLDEEAVAAFQKAQPFPRPPPGMMTGGLVVFDFSFYLDMGGTPRFRFTIPR